MTAIDSGSGEGVPRLRVAVIGAAGRMGLRLIDAIESASDLTLAHQIDSVDSAQTVSLSEIDPTSIDGIIEFTLPDAIAEIAPRIARLGRPWVSGTTGIDPGGRQAIQDAAKSIPVLWAPNMSLGVALLGRLLEQAARFLPASWQMELVETHHGAKLDAPSGTALALSERWTGIRGGEQIEGRSGRTGPRPSDQVGLHSIRLPEIVGRHQVLLGGPGEEMELAHRALDRGAFVAGALEAFRWLVGRSAGLYTLEDWARDRLG